MRPMRSINGAPEEEAGRKKSSALAEKTACERNCASVGLPIGIQLMRRRPWRDDMVLAAMRVIERAPPKRADFPPADAI